jgi:GAF domain-containing protein
MSTPTQQLRRIFERQADCETLLREALQQMMQVCGARSASLVIHRRQARALELALVTGAQPAHSPEQARFPEGRGVAGDVIRSGRSALVNDPAADARFFDVVDKVSGFATRNLLVVPVVQAGHVVAAISAVNKDGGFDEEDRDRAVALVGALEQQLRLLDDADLFFAG